ncbi:CD276 antigen-like [Chaetodon trifascialis]|uniref:CD276 antigen-like n=1 Tax=Chaetodon trifascialis TaxID=109706 RepID=UPI003995F71E
MRMAGIKGVVFVVVLTFLQSPARGDTEVTCVVMESCVLPCSFQGGTDEVIHWIQLAGDKTVHTYYDNQDQLAHQEQRFRNRTSLFKDQISRGNASLMLTRVKVQDQGSYKCYTSTINSNEESFVNLKVEDAQVTCVSMESCVLPCSFQGGTDVFIQWIQLAGDKTVHTYYDNQDQLADQEQRFRNRTSLFKDQISRGNASLMLTRVEVQDQGSYKCYTSTINGDEESFINLKVEGAAPTDPPSVPPSPSRPSVKGEEGEQTHEMKRLQGQETRDDEDEDDGVTVK